jgi:hypothetical protein
LRHHDPSGARGNAESALSTQDITSRPANRKVSGNIIAKRSSLRGSAKTATARRKAGPS